LSRGFIFYALPISTSVNFVIHSFCMNFQKKISFYLLFYLFLSESQYLVAQTTLPTKKDSITLPVDSTRFFSFSENGFPYGNAGDLKKIDNKLDAFQNFHERQASLGNAGAPEKQLQLPEPNAIDFRRSINNFSTFGFLPQNRTFYTSEKPYTKLQYIVGQKQELNVSIIHAHPFGKNCNIAFGFNRIRSTGFYQRQNTNNTSLDLNGWYRAPGKRYAMLSDIYWTSDNVAENGGIKNDSDFDFAKQLDRHLVNVNLSSAETRQRMRGIWLKEFWYFGSVIDTISDKNDSGNVRTEIRPSWAIVHTISLSDEKYSYTDQDPPIGFYPNIFRDSLLGKDSTYLWRFENGIWLERFDVGENKTKRFLSGKIGLREENGEISNDTIRFMFQNIFVDGSLKLAMKNKWWNSVVLKGWYVLNGTNKNDYFASGETVTKELTKFKLILFLNSKISLTQPDFIYRHYSGDFLRWQNDLTQTGIANVKAGIEKKIGTDVFQVCGGLFEYSRPTYFDSTFTPVQYSKSVQALFAQASCIVGTTGFKIRSNITWNDMPKDSPIRLPEFIVRESVYGNFRLFKNALQLQAGVDATWYSAYFADGYNPNLAQFYVQDSKSIGNYIFLDPFVSFKVKPVRVFVTANHVNAGWFGRKYYQVPHYPGNDFALKFGLSWTFND